MIARTDLFDELGLDRLGADSRALAQITLDFADELQAERSARVAIQAARDKLQGIVGKAAYNQIAEAVTARVS